jgi:oligopeptide transport system permease protein
MQQWEQYGYVDYISYPEYLQTVAQGASYDSAVTLGKTEREDSADARRYVQAFNQTYTDKGYQVVRLTGVMRGGKYQEGGEPRLYAYRDIPVLTRLLRYFRDLVAIDTVSYVKEPIEDRGYTFTLYDPAYGGEKFSPAILGNGSYHKYLLYFDDTFPYLHQNFITFNLGRSYSVNAGVDVTETMTDSQGSFVYREVTYPTGVTQLSADDLHSATYVSGSLQAGSELVKTLFDDDYTGIITRKSGMSKLGYSFVIGLCAVILSYLLAIPLGVLMASKKEKLPDRLGTAYIVFILAVPSLAYIFLFKALGGRLGLPTVFNMEKPDWRMYVLPILSLALPSAAGLMKWMRRYTVDQLGGEYVKFARAEGLTEREIFTGHILPNAMIPIAHGIPAGLLGALTGAIITERVYVVPGAGNLLTTAINMYDNGVIVGMTLFYGILSVTAVILGDVLISVLDPRIAMGRKG